MVLIRGGLVVSSKGMGSADVLINDELIERIGPHIDVTPDRVVEARGCLVGPGLVDVHTHLRDPGQTWKEDLESGSRSAAAGGFTAIVAMPNTEPSLDTPSRVGDVAGRGRDVGLVEVSVAAALTKGRAGLEPVDLEALHDCGVRIFTDDGDCVQDSGLLRLIMSRLAVLPGAVLAQHAEDTKLTRSGHMHAGATSERLGVEGLRPEAEVEIVARDLELVRQTGVRYHCQHVSTAATVELLGHAKDEGLPVTAEVTPHHMSFEVSDVEGLDPNFKMYPPLRSTEDRLALRSALNDGTIDLVATDHAPHSLSEKAVDFVDAPRGVIGLETAAPVVWDVVRDPLRFFDCMSVRPSLLAGLDTQGHLLEEGGPANIVVFDPDEQWTPDQFLSKSANSPYLGKQMIGRATATVHGGLVVHELEPGRV